MGINEMVQEWRIKAADGTLTLDEMRKAIECLRFARTKATEKAKKKGTSKKVVNSEELLNELEALK